MNILQIPIGAKLIDRDAELELSIRQSLARLRAPPGALLTDIEQERLPTVTPSRYCRSPGMRHHSQK